MSVIKHIVEIQEPELDAQLVAGSIAQQLERRVASAAPMKRAVQSAIHAARARRHPHQLLGTSGRRRNRRAWNGIAEGRVPQHTLRADVDYGVATAFHHLGTCGREVWIFKGRSWSTSPMRRQEVAEGEAGVASRRSFERGSEG